VNAETARLHDRFRAQSGGTATHLARRPPSKISLVYTVGFGRRAILREVTAAVRSPTRCVRRSSANYFPNPANDLATYKTQTVV
jgi:hypothetical protein